MIGITRQGTNREFPLLQTEAAPGITVNWWFVLQACDTYPNRGPSSTFYNLYRENYIFVPQKESFPRTTLGIYST